MSTELTKENYKTNHDYMSYSRFSKFNKCEAAAANHFQEPATDAQLVGSYVDAHFSNEMDEFRGEHPEIFNSRTGELKRDFVKADDIISRIESDELFMKFMSGEKQKIMTGDIAGTPFKIKMDSYIEDKAIVDLKVMKDFKKIWSDAFGRYTTFVEAYDYDIEMAIFQEIVFQNTGKRLPCYLACITKEEPSDLAILEIPQETLDKALNFVVNSMPRIKEIISGKIAPHRCETCAYCRMTKRARVINFELVGFTGDKLREEGIECDDPIVTEYNNKEEA